MTEPVTKTSYCRFVVGKAYAFGLVFTFTSTICSPKTRPGCRRYKNG
jgi:hypothetical protein